MPDTAARPKAHATASKVVRKSPTRAKQSAKVQSPKRTIVKSSPKRAEVKASPKRVAKAAEVKASPKRAAKAAAEVKASPKRAAKAAEVKKSPKRVASPKRAKAAESPKRKADLIAGGDKKLDKLSNRNTGKRPRVKDPQYLLQRADESGRAEMVASILT